MTTAHETHAAAGTAATTARAEAKKEWWKNPIALNIAIAIGVITIALTINFSFEFNFFWKLLVGTALVWGGKKIAKGKIGPVVLWGNILRGLGWAMIVLALLNSGVRAVTEKSVGWVDQTLTEMATGNSTASKVVPFLQEKVYVPVDLRHVKHGEGVTVPMGIGTTAVLRMTTTMVKDGYGNYACPDAKLLRELGTSLTYQVVAGEKTSGVQVTLSEESKVKLAKLNISSVDTTFTLTKGPIYGASPCVNVIGKK